jgi:hypothetical protein
MSYNLLLDDIRSPEDVANYILPVEIRPLYRKEKWVVVRSFSDFKSTILALGLPKRISFDHDLADDHYHINFNYWELDPSIREQYDDTGYDAAKWLCDYCQKHSLKLPECYVHSANPVGRENIKSYLENFEKHRQSQ